MKGKISNGSYQNSIDKAKEEPDKTNKHDCNLWVSVKVNKKKAIPSDVSNLMKSITHDIFEIDIIIVSQLTRVFEETHTVTE
jgi:hypothetical protein